MLGSILPVNWTFFIRRLLRESAASGVQFILFSVPWRFFFPYLKTLLFRVFFSLVVVNTRILHVPFPAKFLLFVDLIGGSEWGGPLVGCRLKFSYTLSVVG